MSEFIYRLYNEDIQNFNGFVGITNSVNECMTEHLKIAYDEKDPKYNENLYKKIRETGIDKWKIEILEVLVKKNNKRKTT